MAGAFQAEAVVCAVGSEVDWSSREGVEGDKVSGGTEDSGSLL